MTSVHQCSKVVFPFLFLCFKNNIHFALHFIHLPRRDLLQLFSFFFTAAFASVIFIVWCIGIKLFHPIVMNKRIESFLCDVVIMISRKSRLQTLPCRFVSFHNTNIHGFLGVCESPLATVSRSSKKRFLVSIFQGIAASKRVSSFFLAYLIVSLYSSTSGTMKFVLSIFLHCRPFLASR